MTYNANTSRKRILFILPSLSYGGAERILVYIATHIDRDKFEPVLIILGPKQDKGFTVSEIDTVFLEKSRLLFSLRALFHCLHNTAPDLVVSAIGHVNIAMGFLAIFFPKITFVAREVNVISALKQLTNSKDLMFNRYLIRWSYRFHHKIICQSIDMRDDLFKNYGIAAPKLEVINNPITNTFIPKLEIPPILGEGYRFITVGRLAKQKGHLRILQALQKLPMNFHYTIVGDGPEREELLSTIAHMGLTSQITHISHTDEVATYLKESHLFLQGSYVEGFPNALLESCAVGTPVLAFRALGGIDEIIVPDVNGLIAEDEDDFTHKIVVMCARLSQWSPKLISDSVYERYNSKKIIAQYEACFQGR